MRKKYSKKRLDVCEVIKDHSEMSNRKYLAAEIEFAGNAARDKVKARIHFPVGRVHHLLKKGNYSQRVSAGDSGQ